MFFRILPYFKKKQAQMGFTLIELVVVIAILGILATIAVPRILNTLDSARSRADEANVNILNNAIQMFYVEKGRYPTSLDELVDEYLNEIPSPPSGYSDYDSAERKEMKNGAIVKIK
ncbi:MAG: prepilin-type N-terminal cleavage/methylation domain-containing protein [Firmicutes bacterium]|jgi:type II secretion system protein G|nr:prepilin-type N-terminal cleavage/methylation domain-containing protein [Bacillota bacterium]